ncbi:hypothetical protein SY88_19380 [Clostridiales bacterium PH28_bin88]|nr:hypothetical protein SY88_19380 [Clostridiales bacterium PH28_bin88]
MEAILRGINPWLAGGPKKKALFAAVLALVLTLLLAVGYHALRKHVTVLVDGQRMVVGTFAGTVGEVLSQQGIVLGEKDVTLPALNTVIDEGMEITVRRAFPVAVTADGQTREVLTPPVEVANLLEQAGIALSPLDRVQPGLEEELQPGDRVVVTRVTTKDISETRELSYTTEKRDDNTLERGIRKIVRRGQKGLEKLLIRVTYEDGREVKREVVGREVVKQPVSQLIAMGTISLASRGGHTFRFREVRVMEATAYTHTGNTTYTGVYPQVGMVAVDPAVIPLAQKLYVEGYGYAVARDIGSAIKGDRIDLFMETAKEALRWGRKKVKVYVLE